MGTQEAQENLVLFVLLLCFLWFVPLFLEHRCWTTRPGHLAFFLRGLFAIVHVRRRLRQDVMELISKALERESFFEELADAGGTEQEDAENLVVSSGSIDQFRRGVIQFGRCVHIWELIFFV